MLLLVLKRSKIYKYANFIILLVLLVLYIIFTSENTLEAVKIIISAAAIAIFIRTFFIQPFTIPSGSMIPTLLVGDFIFVSQYKYGYSRYSLPLSLPLIKNRIFSKLPERGDVVVFKTPRDNKTDYVKTLVGLPGDSIQVKSGILYINGNKIKRERISNHNDDYLNKFKMAEVPLKSVDRLFGGSSTFKSLPWIKEYLKWFFWGLKKIAF